MGRMINLISIDAFRKVVTTSGTPENLAPKYAASTIAFVRSTVIGVNDTITDSAAQFLVEGFKAGDKLVITGTVSNNIEVTIEAVVAGTITITRQGALTDESAGTAFTLVPKNGKPVADGVSVVIKAKNANTGTITLAGTAARALNTNTAYESYFTLLANQSVEVQVKNLNQIWMDATVSGEGVEIAFEA